MAEIYTSGSWVVKEGREQEFVDAWRELAEWTKGEIGGAGNPRLLRDRDNPDRFLSIGSWDDVQAVEAWRASEGFQQRIGKIRELLEDLVPCLITDQALPFQRVLFAYCAVYLESLARIREMSRHRL